MPCVKEMMIMMMMIIIIIIIYCPVPAIHRPVSDKFTTGLLIFLCCAGNFGAIWRACGQLLLDT